MKTIKFTYVDSVTRVSVENEPSVHGPEFPKIKGLQFLFARESLYPTQVPFFVGTCDDDADLSVDGFIKELTDDELEKERGFETDFQAQRVRTQRTLTLQSTDWTQLADSPVDKEAWASYRQALRDIPNQDGFPWEVTWPFQPD
jgi:hypothetical protein